MLVHEIMTTKTVSVGMQDTLARVKHLFEEHGFHHLLVIEKGVVMGVISDRDLLRNISPFVDKLAEREQDAATLQRRAHQIMTRRPVTVGADDTVEAAAQLMLDRGVACLPVIDESSRLVGITTMKDLVRGLCGKANTTA